MNKKIITEILALTLLIITLPNIHAAVWDSNYSRCIDTNFTYNLNAYARINETYPLKIILNNTIINNTQRRSDWGDIRFANGTCNNIGSDYTYTQIFYNSTQEETIIFLRANDIINNTPAKIAMYYGKNSATHTNPASATINFGTGAGVDVSIHTFDKDAELNQSHSTTNSGGNYYRGYFPSDLLDNSDIFNMTLRDNLGGGAWNISKSPGMQGRGQLEFTRPYDWGSPGSFIHETNAAAYKTLEIGSAQSTRGLSVGFRITFNDLHTNTSKKHSLTSIGDRWWNTNLPGQINPQIFDVYFTQTSGSAGNLCYNVSYNDGEVSGCQAITGLAENISYPFAFIAQKNSLSTKRTVLIFNNTVYLDSQVAYSGGTYPFKINSNCPTNTNSICINKIAFGAKIEYQGTYDGSINPFNQSVASGWDILYGSIDDIIVGSMTLSDTFNEKMYPAFWIAWGKNATFAQGQTFKTFPAPIINCTLDQASIISGEDSSFSIAHTPISCDNSTEGDNVTLWLSVNGTFKYQNSTLLCSETGKANIVFAKGNYSKGATITMTCGGTSSSMNIGINYTLNYTVGGNRGNPITNLTCEPLNKTSIICSWINAQSNQKAILVFKNGLFTANLTNIILSVGSVQQNGTLPQVLANVTFCNDEANFTGGTHNATNCALQLSAGNYWSMDSGIETNHPTATIITKLCVNIPGGTNNKLYPTSVCGTFDAANRYHAENQDATHWQLKADFGDFSAVSNLLYNTTYCLNFTTDNAANRSKACVEGSSCTSLNLFSHASTYENCSGFELNTISGGTLKLFNYSVIQINDSYNISVPTINGTITLMNGTDTSNICDGGITNDQCYEEMINNLYSSQFNSTKNIGGLLSVPWFNRDDFCDNAHLQTFAGQPFTPNISTAYYEVTDQLSEVGHVSCNSKQENKCRQFKDTITNMTVNKGSLPGWRCVNNQTKGSITPADCARTSVNGNNDTASDANARTAIAYFNGANNTFFTNTTFKIELLNAGLQILTDMYHYEIVHQCHNSTLAFLGSPQICEWGAAGANSASGGLASTDFGYTGYYQDLTLAFVLGCQYNSTYCAVAANMTLNYLEAAKFNGTALTMPPGRSFSWITAANDTKNASCTNTCSPTIFDGADAIRAMQWGETLYFALQRGINLPGIQTYMNLWVAAYIGTANNTVVLQYYPNSTAAAASQSGYLAQGLQASGISYNDSNLFRQVLYYALHHYNSGQKTWDYASCFGVYGQTIAMRAFALGLGRPLPSNAQTIATGQLGYTFTGLTPNTTYNLSFQGIGDDDTAGNLTANISYTLVNLIPVITSSTPTNTTPTYAENTTQNFSVTATDDDTNLIIQWFKDNILQTIGDFFTWVIGFNEQGTHNITAVISDIYGANTSTTWNVTITDDFPSPSAAAFNPNGGLYRTYIPLSCAAQNGYSSVSYYNIYVSKNGGAYAQISTNNKYGALQYDITQDNYYTNYTFQCDAIGDAGNSTGYSGLFTRDYINEFYATAKITNGRFNTLQPYEMGLYYDAQNPNNNIDINYAYADCNGDGQYDYIYNYTGNNISRIKTTYDCVFQKGTVKYQIGVFIRKTPGTTWEGSGCASDYDYSNTCNVIKEYSINVN